MPILFRGKEPATDADAKGDEDVNDFEAIDFFRDDSMLVDPYPYFEALRAKCPVWREPHHQVVMVTGYEEAMAVYNDTETFSSCTSVTGPFPGFPVPSRATTSPHSLRNTATSSR